MSIPRDIAGKKLIKKLEIFNYKIVKQTGSHIKITSFLNGEHHVTIPAHKSLKVGTLNAILNDIAKYIGISKEDLIKKLF